MNLKLAKTRKDLSVWLISAIWLLVNSLALLIWGSIGTAISSPIMLALVAGFVFWTKRNHKVNDWLETKL